MTNRGKFAAVINCMDGRTQLPVNEWLRQRYAVDYVDTVTEPGPVKGLAEYDREMVESIRRRVEISVSRHGTKQLAIVAHYDCAGNPVDRESQIRQLRAAADTVLSWKLGVQIDLLWVDENWQVSDAR